MPRPAFVQRERRKIVERSRIGEVVFGMQDGITSTVSVVSSMVAGQQPNSVALFVGSAAAIAGMWSMAVGSFVASRARADVSRVEVARERARIEAAPKHERDELEAIYRSHGMTQRMAHDAAAHVARDPSRLLDIMASEEFGVESSQKTNPVKDSMAMAVSFLGGAAVPIFPYALFAQRIAFVVSIAIAYTALFAIGVAKAHVIGTHVWRSGVQVLALGGAAAALGYLFGTILPRLFGVHVVTG